MNNKESDREETEVRFCGGKNREKIGQKKCERDMNPRKEFRIRVVYFFGTKKEELAFD